MNSHNIIVKLDNAKTEVKQENAKWSVVGPTLIQAFATRNIADLSRQYVKTLKKMASGLEAVTGIGANKPRAIDEIARKTDEEASSLQNQLANEIYRVEWEGKQPALDKRHHPRTNDLLFLLNGNTITCTGLNWINGSSLKTGQGDCNYGDLVCVSSPVDVDKLEGIMRAYEYAGLNPDLIKCTLEGGKPEYRLLLQKAAVAALPTNSEKFKLSYYSDLSEFTRNYYSIISRANAEYQADELDYLLGRNIKSSK